MVQNIEYALHRHCRVSPFKRTVVFQPGFADTSPSYLCIVPRGLLDNLQNLNSTSFRRWDLSYNLHISLGFHFIVPQHPCNALQRQ